MVSYRNSSAAAAVAARGARAAVRAAKAAAAAAAGAAMAGAGAAARGRPSSRLTVLDLGCNDEIVSYNPNLNP